MNYSIHYEKLISRARNRVLDGYSERHHILPKCLGGGNEKANIVSLTPEEHYVAHQLLCKMYPGNRLLIYGVVAMSKRCSGNKAYGWLRRLNSQARVGRTLRKTSRKGIPLTPEWRAKIGAANKGKKRSAEHRKKLSDAHKGFKPTLEQIEKTASANRGKKRPPRSPEWCLKLSQSKKEYYANKRRSSVGLAL